MLSGAHLLVKALIRENTRREPPYQLALHTMSFEQRLCCPKTCEVLVYRDQLDRSPECLVNR